MHATSMINSFILLWIVICSTSSVRIWVKANTNASYSHTAVDCSLFNQDKDIISALSLNFSQNSLNKIIYDPQYRVVVLEINGESNIPSSIYCLKNLVKLKIRNSTMMTFIPSDIQNLQQLQELYLFYNENLMKLPDEIGLLGDLRTLYIISCNKLISLPSTIGQLANSLERLEIHTSGINKLPVELTSLVKLERLVLDGNKAMTHLSSNNMANLVSLYELSLPNTAWTDLTVLNGIPKLYQLVLSSTNLTKLPLSISSLSKLRTLDLRRNELISIPSGSLSQLSDLMSLYLSHNNLKEFPQELVQLKHLKMLSLSSNPIKDVSGIGSIQSLKCLFLSKTQLHSFPSEIAQLSKTLEVLDLTHNNLISLPIEMGNMEQLKFLYLYGNPLSTALKKQVNNIFRNNTKINVVYENLNYATDWCF